MFEICTGCGEYSEAKAFDQDGPYAACPHCGHRRPFRRMPLFVVTGASGAGKSAVALALPALLAECVTLEADTLWCAAFATPEDSYYGFRRLWLRLARDIGQSGRPVVLCGTALPEQFESLPERPYFSEIRYLALVCDESTLSERLRRRPAWRGSNDPTVIERMLRFNDWLMRNATLTEPAMTLLATDSMAPDETSRAVATWVRARCLNSS